MVKVAIDADVNFSTPSDALPLAAEHPRKVAKLAEQYGVTSSIGRLQKALDALPGYIADLPVTGCTFNDLSSTEIRVSLTVDTRTVAEPLPCSRSR